VIYLVTRPVVWSVKIVKYTVTRPAAIVRSRRNRKLRKDVKELKKAGKLS
jgi:hypothetical protein